MTAKTVDGQEKILIPGDPERELRKKRKTEGIFLLEPVVRDLQRLAKKFDLKL